MMLRKRNINIKAVKQFDAFPKIPEDYRKQSAVGGACKQLLLIDY
jgi:hypothetical protein